MPKLVLIGLGGCLGAVARYLLSGLAHRIAGDSTFPSGTLFVNVIGCLLIGMAMGLIEDRGLLGPSLRFLFVVGFLGAFTTFSSFGYETVELFKDSQVVSAGLNIILNVTVGIGAVILGR
jgi:CrcB protein